MAAQSVYSHGGRVRPFDNNRSLHAGSVVLLVREILNSSDNKLQPASLDVHVLLYEHGRGCKERRLDALNKLARRK